MSDPMNGLAQALSQTDASEVKKTLATIIAELQAMLVERQDEKATILARHEQELAQVNEDIDLLQGSLAAMKASPLPAKPAPSKKKAQPTRIGIPQANGTATGYGISFELAQEGADFLLANFDGKDFTQRDMYKGLDWDQSKASQCIRFMREVGFVRKAGVANRRAVLWRIMDKDALNKAREALASAT